MLLNPQCCELTVVHKNSDITLFLVDFNNSHIILALSQMAPGLPFCAWPGGHMAPCKKTTLQQIKTSPGHTEDHTTGH